MSKKVLRFLLCLTILAGAIFLFCVTPQSPWDNAANAKIYLILKNSEDKVATEAAISDTVGNAIKVGVYPSLSKFIDSVRISVNNFDNRTDSVIIIKTFSNDLDTQWFDFTFSKVERCTAFVDGFIHGGTDQSLKGVITIFGKPVSATINPSKDSVTVDSLATFTVTATGDAPFTYQWAHGNTSLTGKTGVALVINHLTLADSGLYSCLVKDKWGDTTTANPARLVVSPKQVVIINTKPGLVITGRKNILNSEICTLTVSVTDPDSGQTDSIFMLRGPSGSTFANNKMIWAPAAGFIGADTAVFTARDNGVPPMADTQKVAIVVSSTVINTAPQWAHSSITSSVNEGNTISINLADSVSDVNGDNVTLQLENGNPATDSLTGTTWKYTPSYSDSGLYTVKIKAWDGTDSSILTITLHVVNVPRPPQPQAQSLSTNRNIPLAITLTALDPDGDIITSWAIDTQTTHGTTSMASSGQPNVTYTPTSGFIGTDYFTFKASVGSLMSTFSARVTIRIDTNNIAPVIAQKLSAKTLNKGDSLVLSVTINSDAFPAPKFYWYKTSAPALDSTSISSWKKLALALSDSGYYYVIVKNVAGQDSSGAKVTMQCAPVISPKLAATTTVNAGSATPVLVLVNADATPSPTYQWYFNGQPITTNGTLSSYSKTWAITDTGTYKVIVSNAAGKDSSFTKLTVIPAPNSPTLVSPANNAVNVAINPTLTWNTVTAATTYRVQVSTGNTFSTLVTQDSTLTAGSKAISGLSNNTKYFWRVNATNATGTSAWATDSFTTIVAVPATPALTAPADNATNMAVAPTLTWNPVTGAVTYRVQVSTANTFATILSQDSTLTTGSKAISGLSNSTKYFWRVNATNAGGTSAWATDSFTTIVAAPATPALTAPLDNATNVAVNTTLTWNTVAGATTYRVQVSTVNTFAILYTQDSTLAAGSKAISGLSNGTKYFWRVNATNAGGASAWATDSFTTIVGGPAIPVLTAPADNAANVAVAPTLTWNTVTGATTYRVQVSTINTFATLYTQDSTLTAGTKVISGLSNNTKYFWRVNATNVGGTSAWATDSFTTIVAIPATPVLTTPADNATNVAVSPTLTWNTVAGAATYRVQVSTVNTFTTLYAQDSTLTAGSKAMSGLSNSTKYFWRVNATNAGGTSGWATDSFTTVGVAPVLTHFSPASVTINQGSAVTLTAQLSTAPVPAGNFKWFKNKVWTSVKSTSNPYNVSSAAVYSDSGLYTVSDSNIVGVDTASVLVIIKDTTHPVINLHGSGDTTILVGTTWADPVSASDGYDGNLTASISKSATVNTASPAKYTVNYNVTDSWGNAAVQQTWIVRVVGWETVVDTSVASAPVMTGTMFRMRMSSDSVLYIAYLDHQNNGWLNVKKLVGNSWQQVGSGGGQLSTVASPFFSLAMSFNGKVPYVCYTSPYDSSGAVKYYSGVAWTSVGGSFDQSLNFVDVAIGSNNTTPYVAVQRDQFGTSGPSGVRTFNSTSNNWEFANSDSMSFSQYFNPDYDERVIAVSSSNSIFAASGLNMSLGGGFEVMMLSPTTHQWSAAGSAANVPFDNYGQNIKLISFGNSLYVAANGPTSSGPDVWFLSAPGASWSEIGPAFSNGGGYIGFTVSPSGIPFMMYNPDDTRPITKQYSGAGTSWNFVPQIGDGLTFGNDLQTRIGSQIAVGNGVCYAACLQPSGSYYKVVLRKFQNQ
jgi:hypothetical protein